MDDNTFSSVYDPVTKVETELEYVKGKAWPYHGCCDYRLKTE